VANASSRPLLSLLSSLFASFTLYPLLSLLDALVFGRAVALIQGCRASSRTDTRSRYNGRMRLKTPLLLTLAFSTVTVAQEDVPVWTLVERAISVAGMEEPADAVLRHMTGAAGVRPARNKLSRVLRGLAEPWAPPLLARELRDLLSQPVGRKAQDLADVMPGIADWLDLELPDHPGLVELDDLWTSIANPELTGRALLGELSAYMATSHAILVEAIAGLQDGDGAAHEMLFERSMDFAQVWYGSHSPTEGLSPEDAAFLESWAGTILGDMPVDRELQLGVARALLRLTGEDFRNGLGARLRNIESDNPKRSGFAGDIVAIVGSSPEELVVLGGRRPTNYDAPAALIIDLGGNDTYARAAVVDSSDMLASLVLDLRGDDAFAGTAAHARGGVAILCDLRGADRYTSTRHSQGSSVLGFALLMDVTGDDTYRLEDYGQGHATAGVGLLYDLAGDDSYSAWAYAQGGGLGCGFAALVDGEGNDTYLADLHWPDVYGNSGPESYHGASQGYSAGHRSNISGGIAALIDLGDGEDRYQSGNFSQGGGYYFAYGLMYDDGGDDENHGYRYSQGFGVHQAVGVRWDAAGNDTYRCRSVAHTGMAWDEGVGWFLDDKGDDDYLVGDLGLGGAAQTGIAVFVDGAGKDIYRAGRQSRGGTGGFEYHDKPSIGVMIDLGGDADDYGDAESLGGRGNTSFVPTENVGLFMDLREKTAKKALRSELFKQ
ncbi:MAG: hypothetical protein ACI82F_003713, partial [Planctomycetota bacterium]